jgi:hypothetical protein
MRRASRRASWRCSGDRFRRNAYVVPEWDAACGFSSPRQAVVVRRREERQALEVLDAQPCWLSCPESQYRRKVSLEDHSLTREAALRLSRARECQWLLYDDALPAGSRPDLEARLAQLPVEPFALPADPYRGYLKRRAAERYESLQQGFRSAGRDLASILGSPERYWRLA